jgi:hypothetical protein
MWKSREGIFYLFILSLFYSCTSATTETALFFPVDSLLNAQVRELTAARAELKKTAVIGKEESTSTYVPPDENGWKKELEIFYHINTINKPVNQSLYSTSDQQEDNSELSVRTIRTTAEMPVEFLKVYYRHDPMSPERLVARVRENNTMYEGTRTLEMQFDVVGSKPILRKYLINGGQEMFVGDSVQYGIIGEISISK